jgi:hypothetical protein
MPIQTTEGTGPGSVDRVFPRILNGKVRDVNIARNALDTYKGLVIIDNDNEPGTTLQLDGTMESTGSIESDSFIRGYAAGQLLNTQFYTFNNGVLTNASTSFTDFASVSYTPVSATSKLLIEYHAMYTINGGNGDSWRSRLTVDGTQITWRDQVYNASDDGGGGTRSGVLFPLSMVYTNSSVAAKTIKAQAARVIADDTLSLDTTSAYLRVSEFAR